MRSRISRKAASSVAIAPRSYVSTSTADGGAILSTTRAPSRRHQVGHVEPAVPQLAHPSRACRRDLGGAVNPFGHGPQNLLWLTVLGDALHH
jgi:hypothetical protein